MIYDVTEGVVFSLEQLMKVIGYSFNLLDSIVLGNTTLLAIILSMFLLSALIPILFSVLAYRARRAENTAYNNAHPRQVEHHHYLEGKK